MLQETPIEESASLEEHTKQEWVEVVASSSKRDLIQQSFPPRGNTSLDSGTSDQESAVNPAKGTLVSSINYGTQPVLSTTSPHRGGDRGQDVKKGVTFDQGPRSHGAMINKDFDTSSPQPHDPEETRRHIWVKLKFRPYPREVVKVSQTYVSEASQQREQEVYPNGATAGYRRHSEALRPPLSGHTRLGDTVRVPRVPRLFRRDSCGRSRSASMPVTKCIER
ncbi:hypothetical protein PoHVEF18_000473 [Penicillium ochrochloron]